MHPPGVASLHRIPPVIIYIKSPDCFRAGTVLFQIHYPKNGCCTQINGHYLPTVVT